MYQVAASYNLSKAIAEFKTFEEAETFAMSLTVLENSINFFLNSNNPTFYQVRGPIADYKYDLEKDKTMYRLYNLESHAVEEPCESELEKSKKEESPLSQRKEKCPFCSSNYVLECPVHHNYI